MKNEGKKPGGGRKNREQGIPIPQGQRGEWDAKAKREGQQPKPDKQGGSGTGRQQGGSGAARER